MTNILLSPEDFTTNWSLAGSVGLINADQTTAPDGTSTADRLVDDNLGGSGSVFVGQTVTVATLTQHSFSIFVKPDQLDWCSMGLRNFTTPGNTQSNFFDITNGVEGTTIGLNLDDYGIDAIGGGWFRPWIVFTTDAADTVGDVRIFAADADNDLTVSRDNTSSIFIWGGQLEEGSAPSAYTAESGAVIGGGQAPPYIAITRRTASQMNVKQRMQKPKPNLRDL